MRFVGTSEIPECIGLDIVGILYPEVDLKDRATYLCRISSRYKGVQKVQTPSGSQEMVTVLVPGGTNNHMIRIEIETGTSINHAKT